LHLFHDKLLSIGREVGFRSGARLLRQGEAARGAFLIGAGEVEAQVALPGGGVGPEITPRHRMEQLGTDGALQPPWKEPS
jgi:hypothetical protein